jgi:hypothetical protein
MYSAVLLAGYNNKKAVENYKHIVEEDYGEHFIETGYKPLHEFQLKVQGKIITKPLIQFTLEALVQDSLISEIVIVGHINQIRNRLISYLKTVEKPIKYVDQNDDLSEEIIKTFSINKNETPKDSVGGNLIKGYGASVAFKEKKPALFVASDSPLTTIDFINRFIGICERDIEKTALLMPLIYTDPVKDKLGRTPFLMINDTPMVIPEKTDKYGRNGFRLSSVILGNPFKIDVNMVNVIYSIRKALNPKTQLRIIRICREVGYPGIYNRYFIKKNLTITQCEKISSAFFKGAFKGIIMHDIKSTYDFDGTEKEYIEINRMLKE